MVPEDLNYFQNKFQQNMQKKLLVAIELFNIALLFVVQCKEDFIYANVSNCCDKSFNTNEDLSKYMLWHSRRRSVFD